MRTQIEGQFVSLATEAYEQNGEHKRFDELFVLQADTGKVLTIRVPSEAVNIAEGLKSSCKLGAPIALVCDVRAFTSGKRATMSYSLVYGEALKAA